MKRSLCLFKSLLVFTALLFTPLAGILAAEPAKPQTKPNMVYILLDDAGYGDFGCYGQKTLHTPNVDRLASEGMKFTRHYAGSTVCAPSRCTLMTGLHSGHSRVRGNGPGFVPDTGLAALQKQLFDELKQRGDPRLLGKGAFTTNIPMAMPPCETTMTGSCAAKSSLNNNC